MMIKSIFWSSIFLLSSALSQEEHEVSGPFTSQLSFPSTFKPPQNFRNINLVHIINLEKNYPRETINVVIENIASSAQNEYFIPFTTEQMMTIGALEVRDKNNLDGGVFDVHAIKVESASEAQYYRIRFPQPLAPKSQLIISINFSFLSALKPHPTAIHQSANQFLVYEFSARASSSYKTLKQKTEVKFPNNNVPDYTPSKSEDGASYPTKTGSRFTYGPYSDTPIGAVEPIKVRYQSTKPLIHVSKLERDIEISHWGGNAAFEERYTLTNRAANLSKLFDRVEWASTVYYNPPTTAIKGLKFPLKVGSLTPYFTDVIGNVSTSYFHSSKNEASLEIKPRYPIFGGWKYPFRLGWDVDLKKFLRKLNLADRYVLNVPFLEGPKQIEGVEYKTIELRVILPEGAQNVEYSTTFPVVASEIYLHKTFMDTLGRTTLSLTAINIFDELRDRELIVTYDYTLYAALRKPLVIFSGLLSLFVAASILGGLDLGIRAKSL
ncbi:hypothetical protein K3495_g9264 [Podosphaera aphanis]|nr:hypothetical protein K3495_g9264 [Podosphaera aphanis]